MGDSLSWCCCVMPGDDLVPSDIYFRVRTSASTYHQYVREDIDESPETTTKVLPRVEIVGSSVDPNDATVDHAQFAARHASFSGDSGQTILTQSVVDAVAPLAVQAGSGDGDTNSTQTDDKVIRFVEEIPCPGGNYSFLVFRRDLDRDLEYSGVNVWTQSKGTVQYHIVCIDSDREFVSITNGVPQQGRELPGTFTDMGEPTLSDTVYLFNNDSITDTDLRYHRYPDNLPLTPVTNYYFDPRDELPGKFQLHESRQIDGIDTYDNFHEIVTNRAKINHRTTYPCEFLVQQLNKTTEGFNNLPIIPERGGYPEQDTPVLVAVGPGSMAINCDTYQIDQNTGDAVAQIVQTAVVQSDGAVSVSSQTRDMPYSTGVFGPYLRIPSHATTLSQSEWWEITGFSSFSYSKTNECRGRNEGLYLTADRYACYWSAQDWPRSLVAEVTSMEDVTNFFGANRPGYNWKLSHGTWTGPGRIGSHGTTIAEGKAVLMANGTSFRPNHLVYHYSSDGETNYLCLLCYWEPDEGASTFTRHPKISLNGTTTDAYYVDDVDGAGYGAISWLDPSENIPELTTSGDGFIYSSTKVSEPVKPGPILYAGLFTGSVAGTSHTGAAAAIVQTWYTDGTNATRTGWGYDIIFLDSTTNVRQVKRIQASETSTSQTGLEGLEMLGISDNWLYIRQGVNTGTVFRRDGLYQFEGALGVNGSDPIGNFMRLRPVPDSANGRDIGSTPGTSIANSTYGNVTSWGSSNLGDEF